MDEGLAELFAALLNASHGATIDPETMFLRHAVRVTPDDAPHKVDMLKNLAYNARQRYRKTGQLEDAEEAVDTARQVVHLTPIDSPKRKRVLEDLGNGLCFLFMHCGRREDLEEAIEMLRLGLDEDDPELSVTLNSLGQMIHSRYMLLGHLDDLDESISLSRRAAKLKKGPIVLVGLANKLTTRFFQFGDLADNEEALATAREALMLVEDDMTEATVLDSLGGALELRFQRLGHLEDLQEAVQSSLRAVELSPDGLPDKMLRLNNLGAKLQMRFKRLGAVEDIDAAVQYARQSVQLMPIGNPEMPLCLMNLSKSLGYRYNETGHVEDLNEAIEVAREALEMLKPDSFDKPTLMNGLGTLLFDSFRRTGSFQELEEAISLSQEAVTLRPDNDSDLPSWLNSLGTQLQARADLSGRQEDLLEAIKITEKAIKLTPDDDPGKAFLLSTLGNMLHESYIKGGPVSQLEEAVVVTTRAVEMLEDDNPGKAGALNNLATKLHQRYKRLRRFEDLDAAIQRIKQSLVMKNSDLSAVGGLRNLAEFLETRYNDFHYDEDANKSIESARLAVKMSPNDSPDYTQSLNCLANVLETRRGPQDVEEAIATWREGWLSQVSGPFMRLKTATNLLDVLKREKRYEEAWKLVSDMLKLLPLISTRALNHQDRVDAVRRFANLASDGCALGLEAGVDSKEVLTLLEAGRGSVLSLIMDDRSDVSALSSSHPLEAQKFEDLRRQLNAGTDSPLKILDRFNQTVSDIRHLPGFESFLLPPKIGQLDATVLYVNVNSIRSDAIVLSGSSTELVHLPKLEYAKVARFALKKPDMFQFKDLVDLGKKNQRVVKFLRWLWDVCVHPVLQAAELLGSHRRVHWIGAGLASFLPFHAAGDETAACIDHVVSSYVPTIRALVHAQQHKLPEGSSMLLTTMETTPGELSLAGVAQEVNRIQETVQDITVLAQPTAADVLAALKTCTTFHFAGHGMSSPLDVSQNCILLQKAGDQDPLSVMDLFDVNVKAQLAFLSACSTADNRVYSLADESLHLASGFLVAGFPNVVASQWSASDQVCVDVSGLFYEFLDLQEDRSCARALHHAVTAVRKKHPGMPVLWAPYIHLGV